MEIDSGLRAKIEHMYDLLVRGEYAKIVDLTGGVRLTAGEIVDAVWSYPYAVRYWRVSDQLPIDAIEITGSEPRAWSIHVDAYTAKEGRSDLTMGLTVSEMETGDYSVEFDDLHVL